MVAGGVVGSCSAEVEPLLVVETRVVEVAFVNSVRYWNSETSHSRFRSKQRRRARRTKRPKVRTLAIVLRETKKSKVESVVV